MSEFKFKKFSVKNEQSAMKVNTDGVLLGAWMPLTGRERRLLDVGTGTGVIALMAAQRLEEIASLPLAMTVGQSLAMTVGQSLAMTVGQPLAMTSGPLIHAIDIDEVSVEEARENFKASPWDGMLCAECISLQELASVIARERSDRGNLSGEIASLPLAMTVGQSLAMTSALSRDGGAGASGYDLIFSNPPYFINSLKAPEERRAAARDNATLSHREIIECARKLLNPQGHLALILPTDEAELFLELAAANGLYPNEICKVFTRKGLPPKRYMMDLSFKEIASALPRNDGGEIASLPLAMTSAPLSDGIVIARERSDRGNLFGEIASALPRNDGGEIASALPRNDGGEIASLSLAMTSALHDGGPVVTELCVHDEKKSDYTQEYQSLTRSFYIIF